MAGSESVDWLKLPRAQLVISSTQFDCKTIAHTPISFTSITQAHRDVALTATFNECHDFGNILICLIEIIRTTDI